jgi:hypothetical protein
MNDKEMGDFAAKVANDISEEIDCRETRKQLRACIAWWASECGMTHLKRADAESSNKVLRAVIADMLPYVRRSRSIRARCIGDVATAYLKR